MKNANYIIPIGIGAGLLAWWYFMPSLKWRFLPNGTLEYKFSVNGKTVAGNAGNVKQEGVLNIPVNNTYTLNITTDGTGWVMFDVLKNGKPVISKGANGLNNW